MSTKIQINSLEALERLIGGDSEFEIEIRNSVVQEFAKKHIKCLAQNFSFRDSSIITKLIQDEVKNCIGEEHYFNNTIKLNQKYIVYIQQVIEQKIKDIVVKTTTDVFDTFNLEKMTENRLKLLTIQTVDELVKTKLKKISEQI